jgi:two-component system, LytTR family, response regulator
MRLTAIIIDDEESARQTLGGLIRKYIHDVEVIAEAESVKSGVEVLQKNKADIVFLDIRMSSGTSFDILQKLNEINFEIIFTTAYDAYALKAIKFSALDYLLKPINPLELSAAVEKVRKGKAERPDQSSLQNLRLLSEHRNKPVQEFRKIALPSPKGYTITELHEIIRCEGYKNYTTFYLTSQTRVVVSKTLKEFEEMLEGHGFVRIFQSHLVNLGHVRRYQKGRGGMVEMSDGSALPVSREKKNNLLEKLKTVL